MSEYLIQGETLTGIADAIRPLLGLTGTMTPEQMQTNLTTEQANIAAALAALAEKGVEVPEGANSNALAGLIAAIEAGGGYTSGSFVLTETVKCLSGGVHTIQHNLAQIPSLFILWVNSGVSAIESGTTEVIVVRSDMCRIGWNHSSGASSTIKTSATSYFLGSRWVSATENDITFQNSFAGGFAAGITYEWMAFA